MVIIGTKYLLLWFRVQFSPHLLSRVKVLGTSLLTRWDGKMTLYDGTLSGFVVGEHGPRGTDFV